MKVGITGTRSQITDDQIKEIAAFLKTLPEGSELHHGDCVGADFAVANFAQHFGMRTVCHPPEKEELRAFHHSDEIRHVKSYLARNRTIVDEVDMLMVVPVQDKWQPRGGTWYTHDYAKKKNKPIKIFWPSRGTK